MVEKVPYDRVGDVIDDTFPKVFVGKEFRNCYERLGLWLREQGERSIGKYVLGSGAPVVRPDILHDTDDTGDNEGLLCFGNGFKDVHSDGTLGVLRVDVDNIVGAFSRNCLQYFFNQPAVRVYDGDTKVVIDIPRYHVAKQGRLSNAGLAEDANVPLLVLG